MYTDLENSFINKQRGYLLRVAGIIHLMDLACAGCSDSKIVLGDCKISNSAMERAIRFIDYCHAQWKMLIEPAQNSAQQGIFIKLMSRIHKEEAKNNKKIMEVTVRQIQRWKILGNASSKEIVDKLTEISNSYQLGRLVSKPTGGVVWQVPTKEESAAYLERLVTSMSNG